MNIEKLVRKNILGLKPYTSARSSHLKGVLLDANENAIGSAIEDAYDLQLNRYPDPSQNSIREKLAEYLNVDKSNLVFGVGSDEIIDLLIRIFCDPGSDKVMILQPTYGMYKVACDINNVETVSVDLNKDFQIDFKNIEDNYSNKIKIIFLCSPNNPTGNLLDKNDIEKLAKKYNSIIAVDEAYIDFSEKDSLTKDAVDIKNLVVMRTFSKAWGLAGIRCGYCIADRYIIDLFMKIKAPYNINKYIFHSIENAVENKNVKDRFVEKILAEKKRTFEELGKINGVEMVYNSDANFILFKCANSKDVLNKLAEKGIIIRERSGHKYLSDCLRVTIGTEDENNLFLNSLKEML